MFFNMYKLNKYNRESAVDYAIKYALKRNNEFHNYDHQGGNCTNYISQCLFAGAPKMNFNKENGWYYLSPWETSISWANVIPLHNFLTTNKGEGVFASASSLEMCELGDIIQLKFYGKTTYTHSLIITEIKNKTPEGILICANTRDVKNIPLSSYRYEEFKPLHILGYRTRLWIIIYLFVFQ